MNFGFGGNSRGDPTLPRCSGRPVSELSKSRAPDGEASTSSRTIEGVSKLGRDFSAGDRAFPPVDFSFSSIWLREEKAPDALPIRFSRSVTRKRIFIGSAVGGSFTLSRDLRRMRGGTLAPPLLGRSTAEDLSENNEKTM